MAELSDTLRPAQVPVVHSVKLQNKFQIYFRLRRLARLWNGIVQEKIAILLDGEVITPFSPA